MIRRLLALPPLALAGLVAMAGAAAAHVDVDPVEAPAGETTTLTFSFQHGKDGTATTGLEVLMPEGAEVVAVPEAPGWTSVVDEASGTVSWSGGSVPDGTKAAFSVTVSLPPDPGVALFKTIQTTEAGELAWIQEDEGEQEGSFPAPRITLVANRGATTTDATTTTTMAAASTSTTERRAGTTLEAEQRDDGDDDAAPWIIGSGIAAAAAVGIGGWVLQRRSG